MTMLIALYVMNGACFVAITCGWVVLLRLEPWPRRSLNSWLYITAVTAFCTAMIMGPLSLMPTLP